MTARAMFLIQVQPGREAEFEESWKKEIDTLKSQPGFRSRELLRMVEGPATFVVLSEWDSADDYLAWLHSQQRSRIYGSDLSPLFSNPPVHGVGEVIVRME